MTNPRSYWSRLLLLLALASLPVFSGCTVCRALNANRPGSRIFITRLQTEQGGGPLRLAVKDNIDVRGVVTTAGSRFLATTGQPAKQDAECLAIARERRVRIVGKTNLSELAMSPSGVNEFYGTPRNPFCIWQNRIPGGSSCGSAVAIAGNVADVAFGTDTAGSIRVPAACCGIVGLKTTHGLVSTKGVYPIEPEHLDTVGPMGRDIASAVVGMDLLDRGFLSRYAAARAAHPSPGGIRVGRLRLEGTDPKIDAAVDLALVKAGFRLVPLDAGLAAKWEQAKRDGNVVAAAGTWISGQKYQYSAGVSVRTKVVILAGRINYATKYQAALARRSEWQAALQAAFKKVDFIALPTLQKTPPSVPSALTLDLGLVEAQMLQVQNTVPVNYAGNPAVALPIPARGAGFAVTSLQLIGPDRSEAKLLNAGRFIERANLPSNRGSSYVRLASGCQEEGACELLRCEQPTR